MITVEKVRQVRFVLGADGHWGQAGEFWRRSRLGWIEQRHEQWKQLWGGHKWLGEATERRCSDEIRWTDEWSRQRPTKLWLFVEWNFFVKYNWFHGSLIPIFFIVEEHELHYYSVRLPSLQLKQRNKKTTFLIDRKNKTDFDEKRASIQWWQTSKREHNHRTLNSLIWTTLVCGRL